MLQLLISKIRLPSVLATISRSPILVTSLVKRKFSEISKPAVQNLGKDVMVYKYDNIRKFRLLNLFTISQLFFWVYLGQWSYTGMKDTKIDESKIDEDTPWFKKINLGDAKFKNSLAGACFLIGNLSYFCGFMFTRRSVRYLILKKDQKTVSFVTYGPFGKNAIMDVPLRCISAQESRGSAKTFLPIKVQDRSFYYILDMNGEFKNTRLFDTVIGLSRNFK